MYVRRIPTRVPGTACKNFWPGAWRNNFRPVHRNQGIIGTSEQSCQVNWLVGQFGVAPISELNLTDPHVKSHRNKTHKSGEIDGTTRSIPLGKQQVGQSHFAGGRCPGQIGMNAAASTQGRRPGKGCSHQIDCCRLHVELGHVQKSVDTIFVTVQNSRLIQ